MTSFGGELRQKRQKAGISQRELAARVGLDFSYISKVENDRLPPPAADTIVAISRALNSDPDDLLSLVGKIPTGVQKLVGSNRAALAFLREAQRVDPSEETWKTLALSLQEAKKTYRILLTDALSPQALDLLRAAPDASISLLEVPSAAELRTQLPGYDALIVRGNIPIGADLLEVATQLKIIGRAGVSLETIDLRAASLYGVLVMNTPDSTTTTTAEHTFALLLALCRHVPQAHIAMSSPQSTLNEDDSLVSWSPAAPADKSKPEDRSDFDSFMLGTQLRGKTLGIVGLGRIGKQVAQLAQAFGMTVLAVDPYANEAVAREHEVTLTDLDELLARADIVTLHAVLTPETQGLLNAERIARMKPGARLINTAHGELVDEVALVEALRSGYLAGAALDTFAQEPLPGTSPLRGLSNVVLTPHLGARTREARQDADIQIVQQVLSALRGTDFKNAVNMPVADARLFRQLRPYLLLAERLGNLQMQLAAQPITQVEIEVRGDDVADQSKLMTIAVLKGILDTITDKQVNYINALHLALERGIRVSESRGQAPSHYANQLSCRVVWHGGQRLVVGSLLGREAPRVVQIDDFPLDANLEGIILVLENVDVPGVISRVSGLLAINGINIAEWRLGRRAPGAQALSFVNLDSPASRAVLEGVRQLEGVLNVKLVYL
jgi:D-3-phosphoglycerate dehydrogenase